MVEKDTIIKEAVKFAGIGDFKGSYNHAYEWLKEEEFSITEENYVEKVSGDGKDIEIAWTASRTLTDYFKISLSIKWRILGMSDVETEIDGKKKKMNKFAEIKIDTKGVLVKDYDSKWEKTGMLKFLKDVYQKYVIPGRTKEKEGQVAEIVQDFKEEMKAFFALTGKK
tara:strand:- start:287 stop:790 length:504 start_codon:yes stop_codon:yes gene_type:complete